MRTDISVTKCLSVTCATLFFALFLPIHSYGSTYHDLYVTVQGSGGGTVTSTPVGIDCGTDCSESLMHGSLVALSAQPDINSRFTGWSGDCTGEGTCQVSVDQNISVKATFVPVYKEELTWQKVTTDKDQLLAVWSSGPDDAFSVGDGVINHFDGSVWKNMLRNSNYYFYDIWGTGPDNVYAVGYEKNFQQTYGGRIFHYNGSQWTLLSGVPQIKNLTAIWGSSASNIFVVGNDSSILHYNGYNWTTMPTNHYSFRDIWGSGPTNIFTVSSSGKIFRYNGQSWSEMVSGTTNALVGIWGSGPYDIFAVGSSGTILHYNGTSWATMTSPSGTSSLYSVYGSGLNDVYVVGWGTLLHYTGTSWKRVYSAHAITQRGIWGNSSNDYFTVGDRGSIYHFDGSQWQSMNTDPWGVEGLASIWVSGPDSIYLGGSAGPPEKGWIYHYDGVTFTPINLETIRNNYELYSINAIWGSSANDIFAFSQSWSQEPTILHFDGTSWTPMVVDALYVYKIWGNGPNDVFAVGQGGTIRHYDGTSWSAMDSGVSGNIVGVWGSGSNDVFAVSGYNILHYDGVSWTVVYNTSTLPLSDIWGSGPNDVYAVGSYDTVLHYDGTNWTPIMGNVQLKHHYSIWGSAPGDIYISSEDHSTPSGRFNVQHFDGITWTPIQIGHINSRVIEISGSGSDNVIARTLHGEVFAYNSKADIDKDLLVDKWEVDFFSNLDMGGNDNPDIDMLSNREEFVNLTDPTSSDTDGDGMTDGWEVANELDPLRDDSAIDGDGDGRSNLYEFSHGTNPNFPEPQPPTANAGSDITVLEGQNVFLAGSFFDPDNNTNDIHWTVPAGITLSSTTALTPSFTAPDVGMNGTTLDFSLTVVDDDGLPSSDTVTIIVNWVPTVDAGSDQQIDEGAEVYLTGTADPGGSITSIAWAQINGPEILLNNPATINTSFIAPIFALGIIQELSFQLTLTYADNSQAVDTVIITVSDVPCPSDDLDPDQDGFCNSQDICPGFDDSIDTDQDFVPDGCDPCPNDNPDDTDGDSICNSQDRCPLDKLGDSDGDGVCDSDDMCTGNDFSGDTDQDGVCDNLDPCPLDNPDDTDGDGVCDSTDPCPLDNPDDTDGDTVCDSNDICNGDDATGDTDGDKVCDNIDPCPLDNPNDTDGDTVCDSIDPCPLDNPDDSDGDAVCDSSDICNGDDASGDTDNDGVCDDIDPCPLDNPDDSDGDAVCDSSDICNGDDASGDTDNDGVCDDIDPCPIDNPDDTDGDTVCDSLDPCPLDLLDDADGDTVCDSNDICNGDDASGDTDSDSVCDNIDPCPVDNPDDTDGDTVCDSSDPCPLDLLDDSDGDGVCDSNDICNGDDASGDTDSDGVCDSIDPCPIDNPDDLDGNKACDTYVAKSMDSENVPQSIIGLNHTLSSIEISEDFLLTDVNVEVDITHPWLVDLDLFLISPIGTRVKLSDKNGGSGDNYSATKFDDNASVFITDGQPPYTGSFRPEEPLSILNNQNAKGTWTLEVYDSSSFDDGTLNSWNIEVYGGYCMPTDNDADGLIDCVDSCIGDNATGDTDGDGVCDSNDRCSNFNDGFDSDEDGIPDLCDPCPLDNPDDVDSDSICDSDDLCIGNNVSADSDGDGICDDIDPCPTDNPNDTDNDGLCDSQDPCPLDNPDDADSDGVCDSIDLCNGDDASGDTDSDGICDDIDPCPLDNPDDPDGDGVCTSNDLYIAAVTPSVANTNGKTHITISGTSFGDSQGTGSVIFDGIAAVITLWSDTEIVCIAPIHPLGVVDLTVNMDNNQSDTLSAFFSFETDSDHDGFDDQWELDLFGSLKRVDREADLLCSATADLDFDGDVDGKDLSHFVAVPSLTPSTLANGYGKVCSSAFAALCPTLETCQENAGYWYENRCHAVKLNSIFASSNVPYTPFQITLGGIDQISRGENWQITFNDTLVTPLAIIDQDLGSISSLLPNLPGDMEVKLISPSGCITNSVTLPVDTLTLPNGISVDSVLNASAGAVTASVTQLNESSVSPDFDAAQQLSLKDLADATDVLRVLIDALTYHVLSPKEQFELAAFLANSSEAFSSPPVPASSTSSTMSVMTPFSMSVQSTNPCDWTNLVMTCDWNDIKFNRAAALTQDYLSIVNDALDWGIADPVKNVLSGPVQIILKSMSYVQIISGAIQTNPTYLESYELTSEISPYGFYRIEGDYPDFPQDVAYLTCSGTFTGGSIFKATLNTAAAGLSSLIGKMDGPTTNTVLGHINNTLGKEYTSDSLGELLTKEIPDLYGEISQAKSISDVEFPCGYFDHVINQYPKRPKEIVEVNLESVEDEFGIGASIATAKEVGPTELKLILNDVLHPEHLKYPAEGSVTLEVKNYPPELTEIDECQVVDENSNCVFECVLDENFECLVDIVVGDKEYDTLTFNNMDIHRTWSTWSVKYPNLLGRTVLQYKLNDLARENDVLNILVDDSHGGVKHIQVPIVLITKPEISISQGNTLILQDNIGYNFENVAIGQSQTVFFDIHNKGNGYLTINSIQAQGSSEFSVDTYVASPIPPDGNSSFSVTWTPTSNATMEATIIVSSNDPVTPDFSYSLKGNRSCIYYSSPDGASYEMLCTTISDTGETVTIKREENIIGSLHNVYTGTSTSASNLIYHSYLSFNPPPSTDDLSPGYQYIRFEYNDYETGEMIMASGSKWGYTFTLNSVYGCYKSEPNEPWARWWYKTQISVNNVLVVDQNSAYFEGLMPIANGYSVCEVRPPEAYRTFFNTEQDLARSLIESYMPPGLAEDLAPGKCLEWWTHKDENGNIVKCNL